MPGFDPPESGVTRLSRFRAALARPRGYDQVQALLSADDPAAAVAALTVPELFGLVKEVGLADCQELVQLATPEQLQGCLDLDVWDRDLPQVEALQPWLQTLLDAGPDEFGARFTRLDPELAAWTIAQWARIYDHSLGEEAPEDSDLPLLSTPDTFFTLELTADTEDRARLVAQMIDYLYRYDMVEARHLLMSARSELPAHLEEMSYRWRSGRVADLGYPDFYEALEVFRPLDPATLAPGEHTAEPPPAPAEGDEARVPRALPVAMVAPIMSRPFLGAALERVSDAAEVDRLQAALVYLINRSLAASRVAPGDERAARIGTEHAAATLSLGLETVARGDLDRAVELLRDVSLTRLHRAGYTVTLRLARLARALAPLAVTAGELDSAVLAALLAARPWFPEELGDPPGAGWRAFESRADVHRVAEHLARLGLRIAIAERVLGVDLVALSRHEPRPALDAFARTALARLIGGGELSSAPLGPVELQRARLDDPAPAVAALDARLDEAGVTTGREYLPPLVDSWLGELRDARAALGQPGMDPTMIDTVLLED